MFGKSGHNSVDDVTYDKLLAAWLAHGSIRRAADVVGVSPATAAKYINKPVLSDGRPGIKAALRKKRKETIDKVDKNHTNLVTAGVSFITNSIKDAFQEFSRIRVSASGERQPDGTVLVDEVTFRRMLSLFRELYSLEALFREEVKALNRDYMAPTRVPEDGLLDEEELVEEPMTANGMESKAVGILHKFEEQIFNGYDANERTAAQRSVASLITSATFRKNGAGNNQQGNRADSGSDSDEEEELIAGL